MSVAILVLGESGTGKSTSLRSLDPKETFIINILDKPLPFRGYKNNYHALSADGLAGNYYETDDHSKIMKVIRLINTKRTEIKNLIIDDFGFTLINTYMRRARETGFTKFTDIATNAWEVIMSLRGQRDDLNCIMTMHTEIDQAGRFKPRTIGKLVDQQNIIEASFTFIFHSIIIENQYKFITNNDGCHMAKSSMGCFEDLYIDNDLNHIVTEINNYHNGN